MALPVPYAITAEFNNRKAQVLPLVIPILLFLVRLAQVPAMRIMIVYK